MRARFRRVPLCRRMARHLRGNDSTTATIQVRSLAAGHGAVELFADLDLVVGAGEVVGVVTLNGAGKTTLLRILDGQVWRAGGGLVTEIEAGEP